MIFVRHLSPLPLVPALFVLALLSLASRLLAASPPVLTVLHTFSAGGHGGRNPSDERNLDGARPEAPLIQGRNGALYGTTSSGGAHGTGVVFKINSDGSGFAVLHSFGPLAALFLNKTNSDGAWPKGAMVQGEDGTLYGASDQGGPGGSGTLFSISTDGSAFRVLHAFGSKGELYRNGDGASPAGLTLGSDGLLYGVTTLGGDNGNGLIFQISRNGKQFKVLHTFREVVYGDNVNDGGARPGSAGVFGIQGALYGTTNVGGKHGYGVLYRLTTDGKQFDVLHHFQRSGTGFETNGAFPQGALTLGAYGFLYGSTRQGGRYDGGILYKISPDGHDFAVLHTFSDPKADSLDGSLPDAAPVFGAEGQLYGMASVGGAGGVGVIFRVTADGSKFFILHDFGAPNTQSSSTESGFPAGSLLPGHDGAFYGVAGGGLNGTGTVFRFTLPGAKTADH